MAPALPFIMMGLMAAGTATSIIAATRTPQMPSAPQTSATERSRQSLEAAYAQAQILRQRRGAASTILTGPQGVTQPAQTVKATLGT